MVGLGLCLALALSAPGNPASAMEAADALRTKGMTELGAYPFLQELSGGIGSRIVGSPSAAKAVVWGLATMKSMGAQHVLPIHCMVPHWVRGNVESCQMTYHKRPMKLTCCALGNSPGTVSDGVTGQVVEIHTLQEAQALGVGAKGKILFFNRPFDPTLVATMRAYGEAADQRFAGPAVAAKLGAAAVLVRSMTSDHDDVPHTGVTEFPEGSPRIPAVALSLVAADNLSSALIDDPNLTVNLKLSCRTFPDVDSADVIGEITGTESPQDVIVMGGHLDSWDKGRGAHDDGAGVTQALEALRLLHSLGWKPKRTIRVCLWMNEENSGTGAKAYYEFEKGSKEKVVAGIESDSGGFAPRAFGMSLTADKAGHELSWEPAFSTLEVDHFVPGGEGGADISPLAPLGAALFGLDVESQRYFDYHHSDKDTIDKVDPRELELGAISMALLAWQLSQEGP